MFTLFVIQNDFHPLSDFESSSVAKRLKRVSSKQEIPGQIRAVPHFQIILSFIIMFTLFVFQNDFHPLSTNSRGVVA